MLRIKNNEIFIIRGDSGTLQISAVDDSSTAYTFAVGDRLVFAVKNDPRQDKPLILKEVRVNAAATSVNINLDPSDTKSLPFGVYFYDIQLVKANGWVDTIVPVNAFKVGEEIG